MPAQDEELTSLGEELARLPSQRVFGYVRVSSTKQEQGESPEAQAELIREYCQTHNLGEPFIVTETGTAGKRMFNLPKVGSVPQAEQPQEETNPRPKLLVLLGHLRSVPGSHLIVWRMDRLARLNDEREILYQLLLRSEVELHSTDASEQLWLKTGDSSDPMAALMRQVFGAFAQYEKAVIELRMRTGLQYKANRGGFSGGRPPFGYRLEKHDLVVDPFHAKLVRYIFMVNKKFGWSLRAIADHLTENATDDTKWNHHRVGRIIKNEPLYRGMYKDVFGKIHSRPDLKVLDRDDHDYQQEFLNADT